MVVLPLRWHTIYMPASVQLEQMWPSGVGERLLHTQNNGLISWPPSPGGGGVPFSTNLSRLLSMLDIYHIGEEGWGGDQKGILGRGI